LVTCSSATTGDAAVIDFGVWLSGLFDRLEGDVVSEGLELFDGTGFGSGRVAGSRQIWHRKTRTQPEPKINKPQLDNA
jgi:hypothetical protein